jgi:hypothetical protein
MLHGGYPSQEGLALLARASAAAPERADLAWLHLAVCTQIDSCDPRPQERHLQALAPGNAAAWVGSLARSSQLGDAEQIHEALLGMSEGDRFETYWNTTIVHSSRAIVHTKTMKITEALVVAIGVMAAEAIPSYQYLSRACKGPALEQPGTLAACRRVAEALRHGDTYVSEMIGVAIARRVWPEGSPEYGEALEARRVARYRMAVATDSGSAYDDAASERYLQLLASHRSEQEVFLAQIVGAGRNPKPPADWKESTSAAQ